MSSTLNDSKMLSNKGTCNLLTIVSNMNDYFQPNIITHSGLFSEYVFDWFQKKLYKYNKSSSKHGWKDKLKKAYTILCEMIFIIDYNVRQRDDVSVNHNNSCDEEYQNSMKSIANIMDKERPNTNKESTYVYNQKTIKYYQPLYKQLKKNNLLRRNVHKSHTKYIQKKTMYDFLVIYNYVTKL